MLNFKIVSLILFM